MIYKLGNKVKRRKINVNAQKGAFSLQYFGAPNQIVCNVFDTRLDEINVRSKKMKTFVNKL